MTSVTVTSKGQITISARYEFIAATRLITALKGMFGPASKTVLIEDMNVAIAIHGASVR